MSQLQNTLAGTSGTGIYGMKSDLASTLPFESQASPNGPSTMADMSATRSGRDGLPKSQQFPLPEPPKVPLAPKTLTAGSCGFYMAQLAGYMRQWQTFQQSMLAHFVARQPEMEALTFPAPGGVVHGEGRELVGQLMAQGPRGDQAYATYLVWLQEDERVREHWEISCEKHLAAVKELGRVKAGMKGSAVAASRGA